MVDPSNRRRQRSNSRSNSRSRRSISDFSTITSSENSLNSVIPPPGAAPAEPIRSNSRTINRDAMSNIVGEFITRSNSRSRENNDETPVQSYDSEISPVESQSYQISEGEMDMIKTALIRRLFIEYIVLFILPITKDNFYNSLMNTLDDDKKQPSHIAKIMFKKLIDYINSDLEIRDINLLTDIRNAFQYIENIIYRYIEKEYGIEKNYHEEKDMKILELFHDDFMELVNNLKQYMHTNMRKKEDFNMYIKIYTYVIRLYITSTILPISLKRAHNAFIRNNDKSEYMSKILNLSNLTGVNGMIYVKRME